MSIYCPLAEALGIPTTISILDIPESDWEDHESKVAHSAMNRKMQMERVKDGTHNFLSGDIQREYQRKRVEEGTHHCLGPDMNNKRVKNGTHPFLGGAIGKKANEKQIKDGTHPFLNQKRVICPHCGKEGNEFPMRQWHFDKCKDKK